MNLLLEWIVRYYKQSVKALLMVGIITNWLTITIDLQKTCFTRAHSRELRLTKVTEQNGGIQKSVHEIMCCKVRLRFNVLNLESIAPAQCGGFRDVRVFMIDHSLHVPLPVIVLHISECRIDATLSSHSMRSSRKQLGNNGGFKSFFHQAESCSQAGASGSDHNRIVIVIYDRIRIRYL